MFGKMSRALNNKGRKSNHSNLRVVEIHGLEPKTKS